MELNSATAGALKSLLHKELDTGCQPEVLSQLLSMEAVENGILELSLESNLPCQQDLRSRCNVRDVAAGIPAGNSIL